MAKATLLCAPDDGKLVKALAMSVIRTGRVFSFHASGRSSELSSEHSVELCEKFTFNRVWCRFLSKVHDSRTLRYRWREHGSW